jgi:tripartite-type tricarboxylate transporter receptor subunit TctC
MKKYLMTLALALAASTVAAFPDKPVKIVVPNPAGGPVDVMIRVVADKLGTLWGQPVVIDNKPGASGMISITQLAKAEPDGYTLGTVIASTVTIVPFAVEKFPIDPLKDVQPVMMLARTPFVFVVAQDSPIKTWQDFVRESRQRNLTLGSWSIGTAFHLVWEQTAQQAGIKALYAPSATAGKTLGDLVGGRLDVALDAPASSRGLIEGGKIRALAITSARRFPGLPQTPTLDELGLTGYAPQPWISLMAPAGVPAERIAKIHQDVAAVLRDPEVKARMATLGMLVDGSGPDALARTILEDRREMGPLVKKLDIRLQ